MDNRTLRTSPHVSLLLLVLLPVAAAATDPSPAPRCPALPCRPPNHSSYPFCNTSLPLPDRARSLVSLLTLPEKALLLSDNASGIPRLGIPPYEWWSESLHGAAINGPGVTFSGRTGESGGGIPAATMFPQVILAAAAFNRTLWSRLARAIAVEARAMRNAGQAGLTFWAPNINVFRDPRWGRGQETPGEDPLVAAAYAVEYARGFQGEEEEAMDGRIVGGKGSEDGDGKRVLSQNGAAGAGAGASAGGGGRGRLMLSACCKHYVAYDLEMWGNFTRYTFDAKVTAQDMADTYEPPFRSCVRDGRATCLMCSYTSINGVPACARGDLLRKIRDEWGFQGYITSDCNAVATIYEYQNYTHTAVDAVALALEAGVDLNCGGYYKLYAGPAVENGTVKEAYLDQALANLFLVQLRLGLFDKDGDGGPASSPSVPLWARLGPGDVCCAEHRALALEAAQQGVVLLKNEARTLPLQQHRNNIATTTTTTGSLSVALIGPVAGNASHLLGNYAGVPCSTRSLLDAFRDRRGVSVTFAPGCLGVWCESASAFADAVELASKVDAVVVAAGLDLTQETEDLDRQSLLLPGKQADLVSAVAAASRTPVVLVLLGGGPLDVSFARDDPRVGAILWVGYPGEAGADAVAGAVFGDYSPGGRLPMTWYPESFAKEVPMDDMNMRPDMARGYPGRTHRFYTGPVVFPFGHGLSYSHLRMSIVSAPTTIRLPPSSSALLASTAGTNNRTTVRVDDLGDASCAALRFTVRVAVESLGDGTGSSSRGPAPVAAVVLLFDRFLAPVPTVAGTPRRQLVGFDRVWLVNAASGASSFSEIQVDPCEHLSFADVEGHRVVPLGEHALEVEGGARGAAHRLIVRTAPAGI